MKYALKCIDLYGMLFFNAQNTMSSMNIIFLFLYILGKQKAVVLNRSADRLRSSINDISNINGKIHALQWLFLTACSFKQIQVDLFFTHSKIILMIMISLNISWDTIAEVSDGRIYSSEWIVLSFKWRIQLWNTGHQTSYEQDTIFSHSSPKIYLYWNLTEESLKPWILLLLHYSYIPKEQY